MKQFAPFAYWVCVMAEIRTVAVIGAGAMGRGIAQVAAQGGYQVLIFDAAAGAAQAGIAAVAGQLGQLVDKGRISADDAKAASARLTAAGSLADLAPADLAIEAVVEDLVIKRQLFTALEDLLSPQAILATNTSSIRIASIAAACRHKSRVAGMHFFNPVPVMKLVEVIGAPDTDPAVLERLTEVGRRMGRVPVAVKDGPGFLVNLGGRAYTTEALRIYHEGSATPAQVDAIMRDACGFKLGPFELLDLTGLDVNFPVSMIIYDGFFQDRRLTTSPIHQAMRESGRLGRKTGQGFYAYDAAGKKLPGQEGDADAPINAAPASRVAVVADHQGLLAACLTAAGAALVDDDGQVPLLAAPLGEDCANLAHRLKLDHRRLVAVDPTTIGPHRLTVMTAPGADPAIRAAVIARLAQTGAKVTAIRDSVGFVAQRIRAMIANLGCEMAQTGVAPVADIDMGMELGLNYPQGPLKLAEMIGPSTVLTTLTGLQALTGDDRYRPSAWLRRRAQLGLPIHTAD